MNRGSGISQRLGGSATARGSSDRAHHFVTLALQDIDDQLIIMSGRPSDGGGTGNRAIARAAMGIL